MARGRQANRQLLVITPLSGLLGSLLGSVLVVLLVVLLGGSLGTVDWGMLALTILAGTLISTTAAFLVTAERPDTAHRSPQTERPAPSSPAEPHAYSRPTFAPPPHSQTNRTRPVAPIRQRPEPERQPVAEQARIIPLTSGGTSPSNGTTTRPWWEETSSAAAPADRGEPSPLHRNPAPPLSNYDAESALIAQCPRCGEFRLDVSQSAPAYAFRCRNASCGNTWNWTPGTPWPPVVVRRNLQGGSVPGRTGTTERG